MALAVEKAVRVFLLLSLSAVIYGASACLPSEPHVDCNFHTLSSPKWAELARETEQLTAAWKAVVSGTCEYPAAQFSGRGLVITASERDMSNISIVLENLQLAGFDLPVEIWYSGEVNADVIDTLSTTYRKLVIKNVASFVASSTDLKSTVTIQGEPVFQVKPLAIISSAFEEVLYLDANTIVLSNPAALFASLEYSSTGALFWPDFWQTATQNPIWSILEVEAQGWELEAGQIVINKRRSWAALNLAFFLTNDPAFQKMVNGDKEAFRLAFLATKTMFSMVETPAAIAGPSTAFGSFCGTTMVQHDFTGAPLFLHHFSLKHDATINWQVMKSVEVGKSFSVVPLPPTTINDEPVSCLDLAGSDVIVTMGPFSALEAMLVQHQSDSHPALEHVSDNEVQEFASTVQITTMRKLLQQGNGSFTLPPSDDGTCPFNSNYCYSSQGTTLTCCIVQCSGQFANPDPSIDSPQFCATPTGDIDNPGLPIATTPSPSVLAAGIAPVNGGCATGTFNQPCFPAGGGQPTVCCPSAFYQCAGTNGPTPYCRPLV